jgi:hypothetical protein
MAEKLLPRPATDATGPLPGPLQLTLTEEACRVHAACASNPAALEAALKTAGIPLPFGIIHQRDQAVFLRHWPSCCWIVGNWPGLPENLYLTDISHAQVSLRLSGPMALHFLGNYATADLGKFSSGGVNTIRTCLGPYPVVLFWNTPRDVVILVERSLSQSLVANIRILALRYDP